jgi:hypothetical protein
MINSGLYSQGTLDVTFSIMVKAKRKAHALEMADYQMNEQNIQLDRIQLVNEQGNKKWVKVGLVESIHWLLVDSCDYTNLFKVIGQIRLVLYIDLRAEHYEENIWNPAYRLPHSNLQDRTVWVIPTSNEPAFTQVLSQSLEINESTVKIKAG